MAEPKEPYLNGAFYGPAIPPQQEEPARRSSIGLSNSDFKPYTLLCLAFKILTIVLIAIGIVVLVLWLVYQPQALKISVQGASLARFDLSSSNNTLYYDLALNVSIRNPNQKYDIFYKNIEADAYYNGPRFGFLTLAPFRQRRKDTTTLRLDFKNQAIVVGDTVRATYDREKGEGFYYIDVKLYLRVRLKMIIVQSVVYRPDVDCYLKLPVPVNASAAAVGFSTTQCNVDNFS